MTRLLTAIAAVVAIGGTTVALAQSVPPTYRHRHQLIPPVASVADMQAGLATAIHADGGESVYDPAIGKNVLAMGDALTIGGVSQTTSGYFPRNELVTQIPGSATFTVLPGPYGPKDANGHTWQQVPGQANGNFWPSGILLDGSTIWLLGNAVTGLQTVGDSEVAAFSASTLKFESVTDLGTGTEIWGSSWADPAGGFWVTGTQNVCGGLNDCKQGDLSFIPPGGEAYPASWTTTENVFPPSLNAGTIISPIDVGGTFFAYTKQGDAYGGTLIEELTAPAVSGPWTVTGRTWPTSPPQHDFSYDVQVHLMEDEPAGTVLATFAMNGTAADYYLRFFTIGF